VPTAVHTGTMDAIETLVDLAQRPLAQLDLFWDGIGPERLNAHPAGHPNSIAWLVWHAGRQADAQLADLAGAGQVWAEGGWADRFGDGVPAAGHGFGHSPDEARAVVVADADLLREYLAAVTRMAVDYVSGLRPDALDEIVDAHWDPPVTRGVRLVSIVADALQHVGQAAYVAGMPQVG
jgi:hypothetical protein